MKDLLCLSLCFIPKGQKVFIQDPQDALVNHTYEEGVVYALSTEAITSRRGYQDLSDLLDEDNFLTEDVWLEEEWTEVGFGHGLTPYDFQNATAYWRSESGSTEDLCNTEKLFCDLTLYAKGSPHVRVISVWQVEVSTSYDWESGREEVDYVDIIYQGLLDLAQISLLELSHA